jgi:signal transduction histidine kinase
MAEVARLSAQVINQMKSDFISSISHELRSPLHGVLASVEFLNETELNELQADMVGNIYSSGKVLLDTINHVLDFSKVNQTLKRKSKVPKRKNDKKEGFSSNGHEPLDNTVDPTADVCVLTEEVVESVWVGRNLTKQAYDNPAIRQKSKPQSSIEDSPVTVILDVNWRSDWTFEIDAGGYRRILLNLFANSMKYTKSGFIQVSTTVETNTSLKGRKAGSVLVLKVKDSGKGISKEFLQHHLFKPFTQEDSLAVRRFLANQFFCTLTARSF